MAGSPNPFRQSWPGLGQGQLGYPLLSNFLLSLRDEEEGISLGVGSEHRRKGLELVESFVGDPATQPWPSLRAAEDGRGSKKAEASSALGSAA